MSLRVFVLAALALAMAFAFAWGVRRRLTRGEDWEAFGAPEDPGAASRE